VKKQEGTKRRKDVARVFESLRDDEAPTSVKKREKELLKELKANKRPKAKSSAGLREDFPELERLDDRRPAKRKPQAAIETIDLVETTRKTVKAPKIEPELEFVELEAPNTTPPAPWRTADNGSPSTGRSRSPLPALASLCAAIIVGGGAYAFWRHSSVQPVAPPVAEATEKTAVSAPEKEGPSAAEAERTARRTAALGTAASLEKDGKFAAALEQLAVAEANGATPAQINEPRARLRIAGEQAAVEKALGEASGLAANGDYAKAAETLKSVSTEASKLGRGQEVNDLLAKLDANRAAKERLAVGEDLLQQARAAAWGSDPRKARQLVTDASRLLPGSPVAVALIESRISIVENTPRDMALVDLDLAANAWIYARTAPVTNAEYRAWIETLPLGKRRVPWVTGEIPAGQEALPVKGVRHEDARSFAEAHHLRLPTSREREIIRTALGAPEKEGELDARSQKLSEGFRLVSGAPWGDVSEVVAAPTEESEAAKKQLKAGPIQAAIATRLKSWLLARKSIKCETCAGCTWIKCPACRGSGLVQRRSTDEGQSRCRQCEGDPIHHTVHCPDCVEGLSTKAVQRIRLHYGSCGFWIGEFSEKSIQVTLDASNKSAVVSVDVRYMLHDTTCETRDIRLDSFSTETATWELGHDGQWVVRDPSSGWPSPYRARPLTPR
jgi:hypothetical protein